LPPVTANMTQQQMQAYIDAYALVQAERELQLTNAQYPNFVDRLRKLQDVRRRHLGERRRLMGELSGLLQAQGTDAGRDEAIMAHVKALDDLSQRADTEVRQAYQDLDSVLTPWQRGRYRMFEEQLERRKVELLAKINGGGAVQK
jgi:Spy/CpxP family protein refolding chaperone